MGHIVLRNLFYTGSRAISPLVAALVVAMMFAQPLSSARAGNAPAAVPPVSAADARQVIDVLNNPARRAQVVTTLEAILHVEAKHPAAAAPSAAAPKPAPAPPATAPAPASTVKLNPDSLGAAVVLGASGFLGNLWTQAATTTRTVQSLPLLWGWIVVMATNPLAQSLLRAAIWRVAVAFAAGLAAEHAVRWLLRRPVRVLAMRAPADPVPQPGVPLAADAAGEALAEQGEVEPPRPRRSSAVTLLRRLPLVFARFLLELLPVLAFTLAGHVVVASDLGGTEQTRLVMLAMVDAYAISAAVMSLSRMMLSPDGQRLRLLRVSDVTAAWATHWIRWLTAVTVFGFAIAEVGLALGMSLPAHDGLLKISGLLNHVFLGIMVLQKRRAVRNRIRAPVGATGTIARLRNALAPVWHWIALFFLVAIWIAWAVELRNGFSTILRFFVSIVVIMVLARIALIVLLGLLERAGHVDPVLAERYPGLETRLAFYHPAVQAAARAVVYAVAGVLMLEWWGVPLFHWFADSLLGRRLAAGLGTMVLTLLLAVVVWEAVNGAMQAHLARLTREQQVARSARLRTLLPLLRTGLLVAIVVIAGLTVLSQIGLDIGPLLAGAGILGVAIGFGSQKLVQDLITGIFLLLENAMQVGDWVTVSGLSGSVEKLSVRTIRLRAGDGSVHIIPFSSVTSVTNTNRGIGNASVNVVVSLTEDTDRVGQILKDIAAGMRTEPEFAPRMLSDLQLWGVDKVDGASATILGQIVCIDRDRWAVQREFNRRVKKRFEEEGVELYNPMRTFVVPVRPEAPRPALAQPVGEPARGGA